MQKLEEELGVRLFDRTTRQVTMTQAGRQLLARAERIFSELQSLRAELEGRDEQVGGELRIAAMEVLSIELLPRALAVLIRAHPNLHASSHEMVPELMYSALREGRVDVGLTIGGRAIEGIASQELGRSEGVLVCGASHPLYGRRRITARALEESPFIIPRFLGMEHLPPLDQFPEHLWPRKIGTTIELLQMGVRLAEEGVGLGYFPEISVRQQLRDGRLWSLGGLPDCAPFVLQALTREGVPLRPAVRALLEEVERQVTEASRRPPRRKSRKRR